MITTEQILKNAKAAVSVMNTLDTSQKNSILAACADKLIENTEEILAANALDVADARGKMNDVMIDRLSLTADRISGMAKGIRDVIDLPDPVGNVLDTVIRPNGLKIEKVSVPMGVIAMIYESRPNVTSDCAALAVKSGNVCILRSGKEAFRSSYAIVKAMREALEQLSLPGNIINIIEDTSRESAHTLMKAKGYVDLLIPRGGAGLINACVAEADVPCIETGTGICHVYVDESADIEKAVNIINNAKTSRPSVCNAEEVLLVHEAAAPALLPALYKKLVEDRAAAGLQPVELKLDKKAAELIPGTPAGENDFDTEFLNYILAVKTVSSVDEAIEHIGIHSTHHSDCIITENTENASKFTSCVDSAAVYVNASTRFTDGGEFGLGCEIGISTQKLHARGPMGLKELTTYKYIVTGDGHIR